MKVKKSLVNCRRKEVVNNCADGAEADHQKSGTIWFWKKSTGDCDSGAQKNYVGVVVPLNEEIFGFGRVEKRPICKNRIQG